MLRTSRTCGRRLLVGAAISPTPTGARRDGSTTFDLAGVAAGWFNGFWEFGIQKWDTARGVLLIEETGGKVTDFDGNS